MEFRAIAYDRRGWGGSSEPDDYRRTTIEEQSEDAAALIEAIADDPAVVCGAGLGAVIALDLLLRRSELVSAAVLIEPHAVAAHSGRHRGALRGPPPDRDRRGEPRERDRRLPRPAGCRRSGRESRGPPTRRPRRRGSDPGACSPSWGSRPDGGCRCPGWRARTVPRPSSRPSRRRRCSERLPRRSPHVWPRLRRGRCPRLRRHRTSARPPRSRRSSPRSVRRGQAVRLHLDRAAAAGQHGARLEDHRDDRRWDRGQHGDERVDPEGGPPSSRPGAEAARRQPRRRSPGGR